MKNTARKLEADKPLRAVSADKRENRQARRLALGFGLALVAAALTDGGYIPFEVAVPLLIAGVALLAVAAKEGEGE